MECSRGLEAHGDHAHRVLPDGCIDLVWDPRGGLRVAGPNTTAFVAAMLLLGWLGARAVRALEPDPAARRRLSRFLQDAAPAAREHVPHPTTGGGHG